MKLRQTYVALVERTARGSLPAPGAARHDLLVTYKDGEHPIDVARKIMADRGFPIIHVMGCFGSREIDGEDA